MQLQRILAFASLALLGGAVSSAAAYDFGEFNRESDDKEENKEGRIYGGTEADVTRYPWTVSLRKSPESKTMCGGTLVAPQYIVTAAHCVMPTAYAALGSQRATGEKEGERIKVTKQWVHPGYVKETHDFDVAVFKLETPVNYTTMALPAADGSMNKVNTMAVVRGWGMTESKVQATTLLEVDLKIVSNADCNEDYNGRITVHMLCAGQGSGMDTCQGDSGGGLIAHNAIVGVVSWGGDCGVAPGVFVRVTTVLDFINEKIGAKADSEDTLDLSSEDTLDLSIEDTTDLSIEDTTDLSTAPAATPAPPTYVPPSTLTPAQPKPMRAKKSKYGVKL